MNKEFLKLNDTLRSDPDYFNANLNLTKGQIDLLMNKSELASTVIKDNVAIYNEDLIEELRYRFNKLFNKIESQKRLISKEGYNNVLRYDFVSENEYEKRIDKLFIDPKTKIGYNPKDVSMKINSAASSLELSNSSLASVNIRSISFGNTSSSNIAQRSSLSSSEMFIIKNSGEPVSFDLIVDLEEESTVNSFSFDSLSMYPFDISSIGYFDGSGFTDIAISANNILSKKEIYFPEVTTTKLRISIVLKHSKRTNTIPQYSLSDIVNYNITDNSPEYLLNNYDDFLDIEDSEDGYYYLYHFNISSFNLGYKEKNSFGIFASRSAKIEKPSVFQIEEDAELNNAEVEYYLHKTDYNTNGKKILLSDAIIPILPKGTSGQINEILIPVEPITIDVPSTIDETTVHYAAKLNFSADTSLSVAIFEDGVEISSSSFTVIEDIVYFTSPVNTASDFMINYTPYYISKNYAVPMVKPQLKSMVNHIQKYSPDYEVFLNEFMEEADEGDPYFKIILPELLDETESITIRKISNYDEENGHTYDDSAPDLDITDNAILSGRVLYIPFDTEAYPKLYNTVFEVSGTQLYSSINSESAYYYRPDSSFLINYSAMPENYSYSKVHLVVIARGAGEGPYVNIKDIFLYSDKQINFNFNIEAQYNETNQI